MDAALLVARLLVAAVFLVAGLAKLRDRPGSREAIVGFGVPPRLAAPVALLLPLAELAVATSLVPNRSAWWGAIAALALVLIFAAGIGINLARGRRPDCHCFGQLHSAPAGWLTLLRNGALASVAAFVVWQGPDHPGSSPVAWLADLSSAERASLGAGAILFLLAAVQAAVLINLLRQNGRLLLRIEALEHLVGGDALANAEPAGPELGLPVGTPAPPFALPGLYGETLTLDFLRAGGQPVVLFFTDPGCGPCNALLPEIATWQREYADRLTIALLSRGDPKENRAKSSEHGLMNVVLQQDREVAAAYQEAGTPSAVVVNADATIGSRLAAGADAIRALVAGTVQHEIAAPTPSMPSSNGSGNPTAVAIPQALNVGDPAPTVRLRDLDGHTVNLAGFRGSKVAVLFWNPGCGFCSQILEELKAWEADPPDGAPKLLVVSADDAVANRAMGLGSSVVVDDSFSVGRSFGASGTPSAIVVDEDGKIASPLAVGGPSVLGLLGAAGGNGAVVPPRAAVQQGDEAPDFELPDLDGKIGRLADYRGRETLLLFWNPGCGFCHRMVDELNAWEAERGRDAPEILVVSTGPKEANRQMGLTSRVVLDQSFGIASSFGANGTPMAVLVDEDGRVASDVAAGASAVLALAQGDEPSRLADVAG